jgi:hypothetical protein
LREREREREGRGRERQKGVEGERERGGISERACTNQALYISLIETVY